MSKKLISHLAIFLLALLLVTSVSCKREKTVVDEGGVKITESEVNDRVKQITGSFPKNMPKEQKSKIMEQVRKQTIETMIREQILTQGAKDEGIEVPEKEIDKRVEQMKKFIPKGKFEEMLKKQGLTVDDFRENIERQLLQEQLREKLTKGKIKITEKDIKDYYKKNKSQFVEKAKVRARHILVKTKEKADEVYNKLKAKSDFADLAKKYSTDTQTKPRGGDLGFFEEGQMVPQFSKAAFSLKVNQFSKPVKTQFGWHVIQVLEKKPAKTKTFAESKDLIRQMIKSQKESEIINKWLDGKRKESGIKIK